MKIGTLVPQRDTGRMDIRFSPNGYYGGLHCGETYKYKGNSENLRVNHMVAWYSKTVISSQQVQPVSAAPVCRVALSVPITRAYLSHGWNCKHCRNYHYACPGMLTGTPCFFRPGYEIRGPCTQVENHEYNSKEILL